LTCNQQVVGSTPTAGSIFLPFFLNFNLKNIPLQLFALLVSFWHYITTLRLNLAVKLLHEAEWNINEIARYCGFEYTSYFIHIFRRKHACSPGEYRKSRLRNPHKK